MEGEDLIENCIDAYLEGTVRTWYIFYKGEILLQRKADESLSVPVSVQCPVDNARLTMPFRWLDGVCCMAVLVDELEEKAAGFEHMNLRSSYGKISRTDYRRAGKAFELLEWNGQTLYCGHCGASLCFKTPISKYCPECHQEVWPKMSPAIIVLITRGDEILLVQSKAFKGNYYGLVAGFVELGESLEECVRREVMEETQLEIKNLKYFSSQTWPFPRNIMVGFFAEYKRGELHIQKEELNLGGWFRRDNLPLIPAKLSIARKLIDTWLAESGDADFARAEEKRK